MDLQKAQDLIDRQIWEMKKLESTAKDLIILLAEGKTEKFASLAADAALRSEVLTCRMRHLLYRSASAGKPEYLGKAAELQGMAIYEHGGVTELTLPCLLPHRNMRVSSEYLIDPLYFFLDRYASTHETKRYEDAVLCYVHEYDRALPITRIPDHDNIEEKQVTDVLAAFFLRDDGGLFCDTCNTSVLGDADRTRICIMSKADFPVWYFLQKSNQTPCQNPEKTEKFSAGETKP